MKQYFGGLAMKRLLLLWVLTIAVFSCGPSLAQVPHGIAGFVLGENIDRYRDQIDMDSKIVLRYREYLSEVRVKDIEGGFKKVGYIAFGNCDAPGRIVRIKVKYVFSDKNFYEELLKRFKEKFGKPSKWQGGPFGFHLNWKWFFEDKDNNKISLVLEHYGGHDDEETPGNSVKLTMTNLIDKERRCYEAKHSEAQKDSEKKRKEAKRPQSEEDYDRLMPH
jgi:hypothetical protein